MLVFLTGFMASGKSSVGRCLAEQLGLDFLDLDREIEKKEGMSVAEIFRQKGEPAFRAQETAALREAIGRGSAVVATGGGAVVSAANRELFARSGATFWLNPSFPCLTARLNDAARRERPLLCGGENPRALWSSRLPFYRQADFEIVVSDQESLEETTRRVRRVIEEKLCAT